jgi:hypothetical protein
VYVLIRADDDDRARAIRSRSEPTASSTPRLPCPSLGDSTTGWTPAFDVL